jgi:hypothetical protein
MENEGYGGHDSPVRDLVATHSATDGVDATPSRLVMALSPVTPVNAAGGVSDVVTLVTVINGSFDADDKPRSTVVNISVGCLYPTNGNPHPREC